MTEADAGPGTARGVLAGFDAAAAGYGTYGVTFFSAIAARLVQQAQLRPGDRVPDVGCGAGATLIPVSRAIAPAGQVTGVDLSAPMLERAAAARAALRLGNVTLTQADATDPPYADASFDVITGSMMIFLLPDPGRAVRTWRRLLRPGGTLAVTWNVAEDAAWAPVIAAVDAFVPAGHGFDAVLHHPPFTGIAAVGAMLAGAGFVNVATLTEAIETSYTGPRQWWAASWSQAPRVAWQHIPPGQRTAARTAAFRLLRALVDPAGGSLIRRPAIGYTTARTPARSARPAGPQC